MALIDCETASMRRGVVACAPAGSARATNVCTHACIAALVEAACAPNGAKALQTVITTNKLRDFMPDSSCGCCRGDGNVAARSHRDKRSFLVRATIQLTRHDGTRRAATA